MMPSARAEAARYEKEKKAMRFARLGCVVEHNKSGVLGVLFNQTESTPPCWTFEGVSATELGQRLSDASRTSLPRSPISAGQPCHNGVHPREVGEDKNAECPVSTIMQSLRLRRTSCPLRRCIPTPKASPKVRGHSGRPKGSEEGMRRRLSDIVGITHGHLGG